MSLPWRDKGAVKTCTTIEVGLRDGTICLQAPWTHFGITYDSGTSEGYIVLTIPWKLLSRLLQFPMPHLLLMKSMMSPTPLIELLGDIDLHIELILKDCRIMFDVELLVSLLPQ
jgi:hypothetical protein